MAPEYPALPLPLIIQVGWAALAGKQRNFRQDARRCTRGLSIHVMGSENMPTAGPGVIVFNHYSRPGFFMLWAVLALSATLPTDLHWTMTAAWTETGSFNSRLKAWISKRLFPRLASVYGFTAMPPMPPRQHETAERARAVRQVLAVARRSTPTLIALAPEGQDSADGALRKPPSGVGRFLAHLSKSGFIFYPMGVFETAESLCLNFGIHFDLQIPPGLSPAQIDEIASEAVMRSLAELLPETMRGDYR